MDIGQMLVNAIKKMEEDGRIQQIVEEKLEKTIENIVSEIFGYWGGFRQELEEHLIKTLKINLKELNLESYNAVLLQAVKEKLDETVMEKGVKEFLKNVEGLLADTKDTYKLSEIIEALKENVEPLDEVREVTLHIERSMGCAWIYFDENEGLGKYDCRYRIFTDQDGSVYSVAIDGETYKTYGMIKEFDVRSAMKGMSGVDEILFKLFVSNAKLEIDEDEIDLCVYPDCDF